MNNKALLHIIREILVGEGYLTGLVSYGEPWNEQAEKAWFAFCDRKGHKYNPIPNISDMNDPLRSLVDNKYNLLVKDRIEQGLDPAPVAKVVDPRAYLPNIISNDLSAIPEVIRVSNPFMEQGLDLAAEQQKSIESILRGVGGKPVQKLDRETSRKEKKNKFNRRSKTIVVEQEPANPSAVAAEKVSIKIRG